LAAAEKKPENVSEFLTTSHTQNQHELQPKPLLKAFQPILACASLRRESGQKKSKKKKSPRPSTLSGDFAVSGA